MRISALLLARLSPHSSWPVVQYSPMVRIAETFGHFAIWQ